MNIPSETFDLVREKQELEAFLSTFTAAGPPPPMEDIRPPGPVEPAAPCPAIFGKFDITVPVKKKELSLGEPETDISEPVSLLQEDAELEAVSDQAEDAGEGGREEPPELPAKQVPPAFVEFQQAGRPPESPEERRDVPEMDRTLRIARKTIEETAAANGLSLPVAEDIGEEETKPGSGFVPSAGRGASRRTPVLIGLILCLVLALFAFGYLLVRPGDGQGLVRWLSVNVPFAGKYLEVGGPNRNPVAEQVGIVNLRHRFVRNAALGREIRVVEGTAFNRGGEGISGIRIRGELYDSRGMLAAARMVFCGTGLTADQLETLGEPDLSLALSAARYGLQVNGTVPPGGQTPFMIVFTQEPPGVVRAMVEPVGMDRVRLP